jgi:hypothetical protein
VKLAIQVLSIHSVVLTIAEALEDEAERLGMGLVQTLPDRARMKTRKGCLWTARTVSIWLMMQQTEMGMFYKEEVTEAWAFTRERMTEFSHRRRARPNRP